MTTLSTHDTKRSEDVRARLSLLSELPVEWSERVTSWRAITSRYRPAEVDANTEYLLWQTLVGTWPITPNRLTAYLEKATREAKRRTTWTEPDEDYDTAVRVFVERVLGDEAIIAEVAEFVDRLSPAFRANVLGQKLIALTMPGVPDVYQGCDLVDLSLVDPDNRRPVDYHARSNRLMLLDGGSAPRDLDDEKLLVVSRALRMRREHPDAFGAGSSYLPVTTTSPNAVAFARAGRVVTVASRLTTGLRDGWGDAVVVLPAGRWRDVLSGGTYAGEHRLDDLLGTLPVALLELSEDRQGLFDE